MLSDLELLQVLQEINSQLAGLDASAPQVVRTLDNLEKKLADALYLAAAREKCTEAKDVLKNRLQGGHLGPTGSSEGISHFWVMLCKVAASIPITVFSLGGTGQADAVSDIPHEPVGIHRLVADTEVKPAKRVDSPQQEVENGELEVGRPPAVSLRDNRDQETEYKADIMHLWGKVSHAAQLELLEDFKKQEIDGYHVLVFGSLDTKVTIRGFNSWLKEQASEAGELTPSEDRPFVAHAIQYFRRKLGVELRLVQPGMKPEEWPECTVSFEKKGNSFLFKIASADKSQDRLKRPVSLPLLQAKRRSKATTADPEA